MPWRLRAPSRARQRAQRLAARLAARRGLPVVQDVVGINGPIDLADLARHAVEVDGESVITLQNVSAIEAGGG